MMPSFTNPRLHLDLDGAVEFLHEVQELIDEALLVAGVIGQTIEFDMRMGNKTAHVQVKSDSPREWLIESCSHVFGRDDYDDGWVGPYPDPRVQGAAKTAVRGFIEGGRD